MQVWRICTTVLTCVQHSWFFQALFSLHKHNHISHRASKGHIRNPQMVRLASHCTVASPPELHTCSANCIALCLLRCIKGSCAVHTIRANSMPKQLQKWYNFLYMPRMSCWCDTIHYQHLQFPSYAGFRRWSICNSVIEWVKQNTMCSGSPSL